MTLCLKKCSDNTTLYLKLTLFICFASDIYAWKAAPCVYGCNTWVYLFRGCAEHSWMWPVVTRTHHRPQLLFQLFHKKKETWRIFLSKYDSCSMKFKVRIWLAVIKRICSKDDILLASMGHKEKGLLLHLN